MAKDLKFKLVTPQLIADHLKVMRFINSLIMERQPTPNYPKGGASKSQSHEGPELFIEKGKLPISHKLRESAGTQIAPLNDILGYLKEAGGKLPKEK